MIGCFRSRDWDGALRLIEQGRQSEQVAKLGMLFELYAERIREFQLAPPPDSWNGAYTLHTK
jgi:adenylate cyclase